MSILVGKNVTIEISLGDGRSFRLDSAIVQNLSMVTSVENHTEFDINFLGNSPMQILSKPTTEINLTGRYSTASDFFGFHLDEEKAAEHGLVHGVNFCKGCGSDWIPDGRIEKGKGNCGHCGAPRHWDRTEGDIVPGLDR